MPLDFLEVGASPVPGYTCLQHVGGTAFTSMWTVKAPDGSTRAWKVVDLAVGNAALETRNLELVVRLKHPALNPLLEYHTLKDRKALILETAAPLKSLRDRLKECRHQHPPAVPLYELAGWMTTVAEGLDFLNAPRHEFQGKKVAIYHRELKPENMLLFREGGTIVCKVGDFGLAKPVTDQSNQHSQGLANYDYDPPEFYEGTTSASCDQYSLAIACHELRTGVLPFTGSILEQLSARLTDNPNLATLESDAERAVLRRALQKDPAKRFGSCREFVDAWLRAINATDAERAATVQESPSMRLRRTPPRAGGAPSALATTPNNSLRVTPRPGPRADVAESAAGDRPAGGSSIRMLPPRSSVFRGDEPDPSPSVRTLPPAPPAESEVNEISRIIRHAREAAAAPADDSAPQEVSSVRMRRPAGPTPVVDPAEADPKVPMVWVVIISMIVLGAVAVVAKELVSQQQQAASVRAVDDQRHRAVVDEADLHVGREPPGLY